MMQTANTVTRHWGTGVVVSEFSLAGIVDSARVNGADPGGAPYEQIPPGTVLLDEAALKAEFIASMNVLAAAQDASPVADAELDVQVWRDGYDLPVTSYPADFVGWCFLAASPAPQHSESGAIAFADPRAGSALTAMPGLPWGRQVMIRPVPGAHAVVPGWLTCSVVPVEKGQFAVVAVASSAR